MIKKIIFLLILWEAIHLFIAELALLYIPAGDTFYYVSSLLRVQVPTLAWIWGNFDGAHYIEIARRGYQSNENGFFPLFPLLIHILYKDLFIKSRIYAGLIISHVSFFIALFFTNKLLNLDGYRKITFLVMATILLFPTSFYYTSIYNDSLFFALATGSLYYGRKQNWFRSGLLGGLATLARLNGLALFIALIVEYYIQHRSLSIKNLFKKGGFWIFLIPLFFCGYLLYIQIFFGTFMALFTSMKGWGQDKAVFPLQVIWRYIKILFVYPQLSHFNYWIALLELGSVVFYSYVLWFSYKKIRFSYWIFFFLSILIPSLTGTFQGMPRYGLHIYPLFASIAVLLEKAPEYKKVLYFSISFVLMFILICLYIRGYFVA